MTIRKKIERSVAAGCLVMAVSGCGGSSGDGSAENPARTTSTAEESVATAEQTEQTEQTEQVDQLASAYDECAQPAGVAAAYQDAKPGLDGQGSYEVAAQTIADENGVAIDEVYESLAKEVASYKEDESTLIVRYAWSQGSEGELSPSGFMGGFVYECVAEVLRMPERVSTHISGTRALDGTQTATWDSYEARWTYHPDDGLNVTVWSEP